MTTPASQRIQSYMENGRLYCAFRESAYPYPCDEQEQQRMDMIHSLLLEVCRGSIHQAPMENKINPTILDLGTGTGIWAIDMADKYEKGQVQGIDISNIQPPQIPQNLRFDIGIDYLNPWTFGRSSYDLIHIRQALGSVPNWPFLYNKVFKHVRPGTGHLEQVEIDLEPRCDDNTLPEAPLIQWYEAIREATRRLGRPIEYQHSTRRMLEEVGFVDIQERVYRAPFNTWPTDQRMKKISQVYCACLLHAIEGLSLQPLSKAFRWNFDQIQSLTNAVSRAVMNRKIHAYHNIHIWTARRPQ